MVKPRQRRDRTQTIETAKEFQEAFNNARYFEPGGKELDLEDFAERCFPEPGDLQRFYEDHRAEFAALVPAGRRHPLWWLFDAPEPRDDDREEGEQLDDLGLLTAVEVAQLRIVAIEENLQLHASSYHEGLPFRRPWAWWRYVSSVPRDASISEVEQLIRMDRLTEVERQIICNPRDALAGRIIPNRSRFYYLTQAERQRLGIDKGHDQRVEQFLQECEG
jgi:hypothetical protein